MTMSISKQLGVLAARASHEKKGEWNKVDTDEAKELGLGVVETGSRAAMLSAIVAPLLRILSRGRIKLPGSRQTGVMSGMQGSPGRLQRALGIPRESLLATMKNLKANPITGETLKPWAPISSLRGKGGKPSYLSALAQSATIPALPAMDPSGMSTLGMLATNKLHGLYTPIYNRVLRDRVDAPDQGLPYFPHSDKHFPRVPFSFMDKYNMTRNHDEYKHNVPYWDRMNESEAAEASAAGFPSTRASDWQRANLRAKTNAR